MQSKESSLDFYAFINIYKNDIENSYIKKIYQLNETDFIFQIYRSDIKKKELFISLSRGIAFYDAEKPESASLTAMTLRKYASEKRIIKIEQINFDRVLKITLHTGQEIIVELFSKGNIIITENNIISFALDHHIYKSRKIIVGEPYIPPVNFNPLYDEKTFYDILMSSKASIVKTLATRANLGGDLAEEVLYRLNIDKNAMPQDLKNDVNNIYSMLNDILNETKENKGYYYEPEQILSPVRMFHIREEPSRVFDDFNDGIVYQIKNTKPEEKGQSQLEKRIESQRRSIEEFERLREKYMNYGRFLSENLSNLSKIIEMVRSNVKSNNLKDFNYNNIEITNIRPEKKTFEIKMDDDLIRINYTKSAGENLNIIFDTAKDYKNKIEGAKRAIEESMRLYEKEKNRTEVKKRPRYWFETYHWFFSSNNFMVLAGRDAKTNESLIKKHMEENDIYVHADLYGAPSTLIKSEGNTIDERTIREACIFAISFSRAWPAGIGSGTAYWVYPSQVSKTPESGEFISKGSWVIRGKRNYIFDLPLKLKITVIEYKGNKLAMICPVETEVTGSYVVISPGSKKRSSVASEIASILNIDQNEIESILPPGGSEIIEEKNMLN
ncbi:ribosome rescue protein RqcH [Picrophilus oshimae]|uniref:Predicted component of the ribosome quality control (RQC) complex, YloA/Tae2 family, contains fibronectin-binding (FbpA) and DUF814 domains n=1 Tax=Picrophilus torridus (strain ATCC 700027 / DSM 9790 / JCM 10055 / NBRC 100828 / KAW 2/3) TaxID=1122961 RepID=Q6KZP2_PICTO|nr:ribosome rescue protein RqcH [Picrophilus oshimae]AAT43810.1 hypothetical protein PTO1225 [Picrophilus oshimae DSM 9789]SMD31122.1 Predicted component of the ribosome quality control (RQC) complex, YloA/Tae2 family, contains fibronectin-binding (FbpA) and DUF814 domains [Picrophilus oshimae DSM 9789]